MLHTDIRQDFTRVLAGPLDGLPTADIDGGFDALRQQALATMAAEGFAAEAVSLRYELELHHPGQIWSIRVRIPEGSVDIAQARREFETEYQRLYGHVQNDGTILIASLRMIASASTGASSESATRPASGAPSPLEQRSVWFPGHGWVDANVFDGTDIGSGAELTGPALIEEMTTTVVLRPGDVLTSDAAGNFMIELADDGSAVSRQEQQQLDPVILALMQNRLDQITRHMGWVMTRTARSTIFSQSHHKKKQQQQQQQQQQQRASR